MRILLVSNAKSIHTVRWVNSLAGRGHEVHLAFLSGHEPDLHGVDEQVKLHRLPVGGVAGYYANAFFLRQLALKLHPDVIHAHYASGYGTLARLSRVPYLLSVWGSDVYDFPFQNALNLKIIRRNLRDAVALASTSECMAKQVRTVLRDPAAAVTVTPFGIDLTRFEPGERQLGQSTAAFSIGNVKALAHPYGIDVLVRAAALLRELLPDLQFEVHVYGDGPLQAEIGALAQELRVDDLVCLHGSIAHDEVPNVLAQLDAFCATSLKESFGVAVAEAMAMRLPVVVSDTPGFTELVGDVGIVTPRGDANATAQALARLALDPAAREYLGAAGRRRIEELYNWEDNVDTMVRLYTTISGAR